jgi:hypothetical protein
MKDIQIKNLTETISTKNKQLSFMRQDAKIKEDELKIIIQNSETHVNHSKYKHQTLDEH